VLYRLAQDRSARQNGKLTDQNNANAVNQAATHLSKNKDVAAVVNPLTPQGASGLSK
jgi:hypothetical protein